MIIVVRFFGGGFRIYFKGVFEIILSCCILIIGKDGEIRLFIVVDFEKMVREVIELMVFDGLRIISFVYRDFFVNGVFFEKGL